MTTSKKAGAPLRVALVNDYDIIVNGLAAMLEPFADRVVIAERLVGDEAAGDRVDVTLFDTFGRVRLGADEISALLADERTGRLVVYTWEARPDVASELRSMGVAAVLDKGSSAATLVDALEAVAERRDVAPAIGGAGADLDWPGRVLGLSRRESEVLVLVMQGQRNIEIAAGLYVGEATVKSHLINAYRKLGARNRAQAAAVLARHSSFARRRMPVEPERAQGADPS